MAIYEGNIEDFKKFINGYTRNLVQNLTRKYKKNRSCSHVGCLKRTRLQAAHLKNKERPRIVSEIIKNINQSEKVNNIKIDLNTFEKEFISKHIPIEQSIIILCHTHHLEYDNDSKKIDKIDIIPIESEDDIKEYSELLDDEIMSDLTEIKIGKLIQKRFTELFINNKFSQEFIENLLNKDYCKQNFKITFPVLIELKSEKSFSDNNAYQRYYKDEKLIFEFENNKYLLTKEWKEIHREHFEKWFKSL